MLPLTLRYSSETKLKNILYIGPQLKALVHLNGILNNNGLREQVKEPGNQSLKVHKYNQL